MAELVRMLTGPGAADPRLRPRKVCLSARYASSVSVGVGSTVAVSVAVGSTVAV